MMSKMRNRIEIQAPIRTSDNAGGDSVVFQTFITVFAYLEPKTGSKDFVGDQIEEQITHNIYMRYRSDLLPKHRFKFGTRLFRINRIIDIDERNRYFRIQAIEGVAT